MGCRQIIEKIDRYFERELNDIETYKIEKHLEKCSSCKKEYDEFKEVFDLLSNHPTVLPPEDFTSRIMGEITLKAKSMKFSPLMMKEWGISFVAAGILIFILNTSLGYSIEDISSQIHRESLSTGSWVSKYIKEVPSLLESSYEKINLQDFKIFKNIKIKFNK